ncbi:hypothetical protein F5Y12DRAFT_772432 [Xylaria sp. FL1777]|nr:hypothetical protein F5Y12DRAFT_772432 [Xylaria sp. FL1777]
MPGQKTIDHRSRSPPRRQRACLTCKKAKARCDYENNEIGNGCNRCQRLEIACNPPTTKSLRRPRQVKAKDKLEHARVSTTPAKVPVADTRDTGVDFMPPPPLKEVNDTSNTGTVVASSGNSSQKHHSIPHHPKSLPLQPCISHHLPAGPGFGISWDQAEKAVEDFTSIFTAHLPFIILDHDITARRLCVEKPLLFRAILMIAIDFTSAKSREIRRSIDAWIGQHLLVLEEQNIGALQGLIVYIFWATPHFYSDQRATQLIYFAVGLAHSLGITREASPEDKQAKNESQINEEHRTFLACYYFLSFNSFQFGRPNPLATSHVQYCVDSLERSAELATDFLVVKLVKFRQFIGRIPTVYEGICDTRWCREVSEHASDELNEITKDLDDFMKDVSHRHSKLLLLWSLHNSAIVQLHLPMTYVVPDSAAVSRLQLECLQHCLRTSQKFVSMVRSFSPDGLLYAPFSTLTDLISMLIAMSRLLLVNIDGWDLKQARQSMDLREIIDEILVKLTEGKRVKDVRVAEVAVTNPSSYKPDGPDEDKQNRLHVFIKLIESIRSWLESQGVFSPSKEGPGQETNSSDDTRPSAHIYASPQSPQWNFTYFFESILPMKRSSTA